MDEITDKLQVFIRRCREIDPRQRWYEEMEDSFGDLDDFLYITIEDVGGTGGSEQDGIFKFLLTGKFETMSDFHHTFSTTFHPAGLLWVFTRSSVSSDHSDSPTPSPSKTTS